MSERTSTRFRPAPVGGVLDAGADHGVEQTRAAGWAAGWAAGTRAAAEAATNQRRALDDAQRSTDRESAAQLRVALTLLHRAAQAVSERTVPVLAEAAAALDDGAVVLAQVVLGRELAEADDAARAALARALSLPLEVGVHTVRVHPLDLRVLVRVGAVADLPAGVELVADATLTPGDAVSEFPGGFLDARIGTAVERARRALADDSLEDPR